MEGPLLRGALAVPRCCCLPWCASPGPDAGADICRQYREERFRTTSESTNSRVLWWSLAQTCVLLAMGYWQLRHLKSFFEAKKLV